MMIMNISRKKSILVVIIFITVIFTIYIISKTATCNSEQNIAGYDNIISVKDTTIDTTKDYLLNPTLITTDVKQQWYKLHFDAVLLDCHNDLLYKVRHENCNFYTRDSKTQTGLQRLKEGGIKIQFFALYIPPKQFSNSKNYVLEQINLLNKLQSEYRNDFEIAYNYADIKRILQEGKIVAMMGIEGGTAIEDNLDNINLFYEKGVRYIGLTWNNTNKIGVSAKDEADGKKGGLTKFGKEVVQRMNEVGMLIDVSHLGEQSFWDVTEITKAPIIASHSNCYSLCQHYRNLTDEQIKAIAKTNGIIMVNFLDWFIVTNASKNSKNANEIYKTELNKIYNNYYSDREKYYQELSEFLSKVTPKNEVSIDNLIDHIDHIKELVGIDYIGIGTDFDGGINPPFDLYDATCFPILTKKLAERGYTEIEIRKILGINFLRVFKEVCG